MLKGYVEGLKEVLPEIYVGPDRVGEAIGSWLA